MNDHVTRATVLEDSGDRLAVTAGQDVESIDPRITSYNVCYTKLLRILPHAISAPPDP